MAEEWANSKLGLLYIFAAILAMTSAEVVLWGNPTAEALMAVLVSFVFLFGIINVVFSLSPVQWLMARLEGDTA